MREKIMILVGLTAERSQYEMPQTNFNNYINV